MKLPRITIRRLMILIALAGVLIVYVRRRAYHLRMAALHRREATASAPGRASSRTGYDRLLWTQNRHLQAAEEYERASSRPWLDVGPDPEGSR